MLGMDSYVAAYCTVKTQNVFPAYNADYYLVFFILYSKVNGTPALIGRWADPRVAGSGALAESLTHTLSSLCANCGAFRLISARIPLCLPTSPDYFLNKTL